MTLTYHRWKLFFNSISYTAEHISPLEAEITKLQDAIALVEDEQEYMWAREKASKESEFHCDDFFIGLFSSSHVIKAA